MKTSSLVQTLCVPFCVYYKPGKNEELACKGYAVLERLMQGGRRIDCERCGQAPATTVSDLLVQKMCMSCDFHEQDCDFMQDRTAAPCGGFVLISQLLGSGAIAPDEIS